MGNLSYWQMWFVCIRDITHGHDSCFTPVPAWLAGLTSTDIYRLNDFTYIILTNNNNSKLTQVCHAQVDEVDRVCHWNTKVDCSTTTLYTSAVSVDGFRLTSSMPRTTITRDNAIVYIVWTRLDCSWIQSTLQCPENSGPYNYFVNDNFKS